MVRLGDRFRRAAGRHLASSRHDEAGQDLQPGLLGVSLKGTDIYALPATIAACAAEVARPRCRPAARRHDRGNRRRARSNGRVNCGMRSVPHVAGDTVRLVVVRGENQQRIDSRRRRWWPTIEPYVRPEMGLLPMRVPADSAAPAAQPAGVAFATCFRAVRRRRRDCRTATASSRIGDHEIGTPCELRDQVITWDPGQVVRVRFVRGEQTQDVDLTLGSPDHVHPRLVAPGPAAAGPASRWIGPPWASWRSRFPEVANKCIGARSGQLQSRGVRTGWWCGCTRRASSSQDELVNRWKQLAQDHDLIVLAPQSADEQRWMSTEIEFVRKAIDEVMRTYSIDPTRVVLHGYQAGGAMAYYVAFCPSRCRAGRRPGRSAAAQCDSANRPPTRFNRWPCIVYPQRSRKWRIASSPGNSCSRNSALPGPHAGPAR